MQPLEQGCVLLQAPRQAAKPLLSVRNWRAETVPAQRTAITNVVSNVVLMNFLFILSLVCNFAWPEVRNLESSYFAGLNAGGRMHEPDLVPAGMLQKQSMLQDMCLLQMPPQKGLVVAWLCNCRAETVPADRTAVTNVTSNVFLMNFLFILSRFQLARPGGRTSSSCYFAGLAAMNPQTPVVALGLLKTHPQPRTLGQGCVLLQKWCWQVVS